MDTSFVIKGFFKWSIPGPFFFIFVFSIQQLTVNVQFKCLPMTGFKLLTPGIGSDHSTNWATTTALVIKFNTPSISSTHWCLQECNQTKTIWLKRNKFTTFGWVDVGGGHHGPMSSSVPSKSAVPGLSLEYSIYTLFFTNIWPCNWRFCFRWFY